jgi:TolB-like protein
MKLFIKCLSVFLLVSTLPLYAQNKKRVAVLPLDPAGVEQSDADQVTDMVENAFTNYPSSYEMIERSQINSVLREISFGQTGVTSEIVEAGKQLNANLVVAGRFGKLGSKYTLTLKLIDVDLGKIHRTTSKSAQVPLEDVETALIKPAAEYIANPGLKTFENIVDALSQNKSSNNNITLPKRNSYTLIVKGCTNIVSPSQHLVNQANSWVKVWVGARFLGNTVKVENSNSPSYNAQFSISNYSGEFIYLDVYDDYPFSGSKLVGRATIQKPVSGSYQILRGGYAWGNVIVEIY